MINLEKILSHGQTSKKIFHQPALLHEKFPSNSKASQNNIQNEITHLAGLRPENVPGPQEIDLQNNMATFVDQNGQLTRNATEGS